MLVVAVRTGSQERWRPDCSERLEAGQEMLVACSRDAWQRLHTQVSAP
jgi:Trk K+ transport system NAD-binding subunit